MVWAWIEITGTKNCFLSFTSWWSTAHLLQSNFLLLVEKYLKDIYFIYTKWKWYIWLGILFHQFLHLLLWYDSDHFKSAFQVILTWCYQLSCMELLYMGAAQVMEISFFLIMRNEIFNVGSSLKTVFQDWSWTSY